jgi:RimJ/RimL family protein N-acetyltransferase
VIYPEELLTPRLSLRRRRTGYLDALWPGVESSERELGRFLAWAVEPDRAESYAFFEAMEREWDRGTAWGFTIFLEGTPIGDIGLAGYKPLVQACEVGYWIQTDQSGKGYMTEACSAVVDFGFEMVGLHRIELHASPDNIGSMRVAEKIGFFREGLLRDGSRGRSGYHDVYVYGLLDTDPRMKFH